MKGVVLLLVLVLIPSVTAVWDTFNNDITNNAKLNGSGFINVEKFFVINVSFGMNKQPMVSDLDFDGDNEIVIFSEGYLKLFDKNLSLVAEKIVGDLQGQFDVENMDNDKFIEIIAVVKNGTENFTIWQFNGSDFRVEISFDVSIQNGSQDIRCLDFDKDNKKECIYRDYLGIVHSYEANSNNDELNININDNEISGSKITIVPSIADFDNDDDLDALFWFNDNFAIVDANKNMIMNKDVGTLNNAFPSEAALLGAKFVDLNKDKKYEIAVAWKQDIPKFWSGGWSTHIFLRLYNNSGNIIFTKDYDFIVSSGNYCYLNAVNCLGIASDIFIFDYDNNDVEDLGIYLDDRQFSIFGNFIKFIAMNGSEIASIPTSAENINNKMIDKTVPFVDIDNDNKLEVILKEKIVNLDGSTLFNFTPALKNSPIVADIDGNGVLDIVYSEYNLTKIFSNDFNHSVDLFIGEKDISFSKNDGNEVNVSIVIHDIGNGNANNVEYVIYNTNTMQNVTGKVDVRANNNAAIIKKLNLNENDGVLVQLDFNNEINETNEENNFAFKEYIDFPLVFVSAELEPSNIENEFIDFIKDNLGFGYYTSDENNADVKVYIGKNNLFNKQKLLFTKQNFDFYYDFGNVYFKDKIGTKPYNAIIGAYKENEIANILIYGNEIDGDIAAVKEFINRQSNFLNINENDAFFIDDLNLIAIKIFDFLHNTGNEINYRQDNDAFKQIARNALRDEMFAEKDFSIVSNSGINLRLRNLKPNASSMYLSYLNSSGMPVELPVVLAHGLFSNLSTWQTLASEISNTGRDTWLIEITGGTGQDCDSCPDYTFNELTDDYLPALLNGVLAFTNKNNIQYVGFSNGCRAALDSLERNMFDSNRVETFVAVGCPGGFEGFDIGASGIKLIDDRINRNLQDKKHISFKDMFITGIFNFNAVSKNTEKISMNLWRQYDNWISSNEDKQPGNITVNNFVIIHGNAAGTSDIIVTILDEKHIYNNTKINDTKKRFNVFATHIGLDDRSTTKNLIKKSINKEELSFLERNINLIESD